MHDLPRYAMVLALIAPAAFAQPTTVRSAELRFEVDLPSGWSWVSQEVQRVALSYQTDRVRVAIYAERGITLAQMRSRMQTWFAGCAPTHHGSRTTQVGRLPAYERIATCTSCAPDLRTVETVVDAGDRLLLIEATMAATDLKLGREALRELLAALRITAGVAPRAIYALGEPYRHLARGWSLTMPKDWQQTESATGVTSRNPHERYMALTARFTATTLQDQQKQAREQPGAAVQDLKLFDRDALRIEWIEAALTMNGGRELPTKTVTVHIALDGGVLSVTWTCLAADYERHRPFFNQVFDSVRIAGQSSSR